jgi:hypothetical protein
MDVCKPKSGVVLATLVTKLRIMDGAIASIDSRYITVDSTESVTVKSVEGVKKAWAGDWIVKLNDTSYLVLKDAIFKLLYNKF